jgi:hypothetical protein
VSQFGFKIGLQRGAAQFLQGFIMEFTLTIDWGFGEQVKFSTPDLWKTVALAGFIESLDEFESELDESFDEEVYEYDDEGTAYWLDEENDVWYWYDEESDDWYECEDEEEVEADSAE